jgi:hypothetical protein
MFSSTGKLSMEHFRNLEGFIYKVTKKVCIVVQHLAVNMTVSPAKEAVESTSKQSIRGICILTQNP